MIWIGLGAGGTALVVLIACMWLRYEDYRNAQRAWHTLMFCATLELLLTARANGNHSESLRRLIGDFESIAPEDKVSRDPRGVACQ